MTPLFAAALLAASTPQPLLDGAIDTTSTFSVGLCQDPTGACVLGQSATCSGTLVAPNLVLTARHCVDNGRQLAPLFCDVTFTGVIDPSSLWATVDDDPYDGDPAGWVQAADVLVPESPDLCDADLALIVLEASLPGSPAAVDVDRNLAQSPPDAVAIVGRGVIGVQLTELHGGALYPVSSDDGRHKRRVQEDVPVLCVSDEEGACPVEDITDPSGTFVAAAATLLVGGGTLPGDSGAGVLDQTSFSAGAPRVLGVVSFGTFDAAETPNATGAVRVSRHRTFLVDGAALAAELGGYPLPAWAGGKDEVAPEPEGEPADGGGCATADEGAAALALLAVAVLGVPRRSYGP